MLKCDFMNFKETTELLNLSLKELRKKSKENPDFDLKPLRILPYYLIIIIICVLLFIQYPNTYLIWFLDIFLLILLVKLLLYAKKIRKFKKDLIEIAVLNNKQNLTYDNILNMNVTDIAEEFKLKCSLSPRELVDKFKDKFLEENPEYKPNTDTKKYICICNSPIRYYFYLSQKILSDRDDINFIFIGDEIIKLKYQSKFKVFFIFFFFFQTIIIENLIKVYENKKYDKVYKELKKYTKYTINTIKKYNVSIFHFSIFTKQYLVLLYISSKKINADLNFLPPILKSRLDEALQEEDYIKFIEKELH